MVISFLLIAGLAAFVTGLSTAQAPVQPIIHENPADLTTAQPFDVDSKLMLQLEQMFGSLDKVASSVNLGQFNLSRSSMDSYDRYYQSFRGYLVRMNMTGSKYQLINAEADVAADQLREMINSSELLDADLALYQASCDRNELASATAAALGVQKDYSVLENATGRLELTGATIDRLLQNTSVDTNDLDLGIDTLNAYLGRMDAEAQAPLSLLGNTSLTLAASETGVSGGDVVIFSASLSSGTSPVSGGLVSLYVDNASAGNATTGSDGRCVIGYRVPAGTFGRNLTAVACFDPQGAGLTPAISNSIVLERLPIATRLSINLTPATVQFGDVLQVQGRLSDGGGYPVPGHAVTVYLAGAPVCYAVTDAGGIFACGVPVGATMPAGQVAVKAGYDSSLAPGDVLLNASSPDVMIMVQPEDTQLMLDRPPASAGGGQALNFSGRLTDAGGRPVSSATVGVYDENGLIGSNGTDDAGRYLIPERIPYNDTPGNHSIYAAYRPGTGMALAGSQSDACVILFRQAAPQINVSGVPLCIFPGDMLNVSGQVAGPDGAGLEGVPLTVQVSGTTIGTAVSDAGGRFAVQYQDNLSPGVQGVTVSSGGLAPLLAPASANLSMLALPFDRLTFWVILLVVLALVFLAAARTVPGRLRRSRATPQPPSAPAAAPLPEAPAPPAPSVSFEEEFDRISAGIAGGVDRGQSIVEIYQAARHVAGASGLAVPDSATHRDFFRRLAAHMPALTDHAGTITRYYESAAFGHRPLDEGNIFSALYSLKELHAYLSGAPAGGDA